MVKKVELLVQIIRFESARRNDFLTFCDIFLCESTFFGFRIFIDESVAFIFCVLIAFHSLSLHAGSRQLIFALHDESSKVFTESSVRIILEYIL